jgi:Right handed beta helix region
MRRFSFCCTIALVFLYAAANAATYTIQPDGSGDYPTIQAAINAAFDGDIIELVDGTFTGDGNRDIDYLGKAIAIRSYSGNPDGCVIDCQSLGRGFSFHYGEGPDAVLKGVSIVNGLVSGVGDGGGIACEDASPTIRDCIVANCFAGNSGGGVSCVTSSPTIADCSIRDCSTGSGAGPEGGGGLYCLDSAPFLNRCTLSNNSCALGLNSRGGGLLCDGSSPVLHNCVFIGNSAHRGGGGVACLSASNAQFLSCTFSGNSTTEVDDPDGGGGGLWIHGNSYPSLINCTFYGNSTASSGGGIYCRAPFVLKRSIIAYSLQGKAIECEDGGAIPSLSCCNLYGNAGGDWAGWIASQYGVAGNIWADPMFCDPEDGDFALLEGSPCALFSPPNEECRLIGAWPSGCGPGWCALEIQIPNGGEFLTAGDHVDITWEPAPSCGSTVLIELLHSGEVCQVINGSAENTGTSNWIAAQCGTATSGYSIQLTDLDTGAFDFSDGLFGINPACIPTVTHPMGGQHLHVGHEFFITWDTTPSCGAFVDIDLLRNGEICSPIAQAVANSGSHLWYAESCSTWMANYQISVTDLETSAADTSEGYFSFHPEYQIISVIDIENDQGGQVGINWYRSQYDAPEGPTITGYGVYRRRDRSQGDVRRVPRLEPESVERLRNMRIDGWDYIATVPAHGDSIYQCVSPTLCDSTVADGICWSVFFIRAMTPDPLEYYDTEPDSGYSVDNLAPSVPTGLMMLDAELLWDAAIEPDFEYHTVYGSDNPVLGEDAMLLDYTVEQVYDVSGTDFDFYHVTTSDRAGNESEAASVQSPTSSAPSSDPVPTCFAFGAGQPNPFRLQASLVFDLPAAEHVELIIYDAMGRQVRVLANERYAGGQHQLKWDGMSTNRLPQAPGVYFARIRAGGNEASRRLVRIQ